MMPSTPTDPAKTPRATVPNRVVVSLISQPLYGFQGPAQVASVKVYLSTLVPKLPMARTVVVPHSVLVVITST